MGSDVELTVIKDKAALGGRLTRREMVQRLLAGMGAGAAWPLVAASHPIHKHLTNDAIFAEAEKLGATDWKPLVPNAQQNETLGALAESIVPGSMKAHVNRFIDLLLSVDTPEHRQKFAESLKAFDTESQKRFGKRFPSLNASQQNEVLTEASAEPADAEQRKSEHSVEGDSSNPSAGKEHAALHEHFEDLKGWISGAYYSSEEGMRELGWTGEYVFESFPGCQHPEGHR